MGLADAGSAARIVRPKPYNMRNSEFDCMSCLTKMMKPSGPNPNPNERFRGRKDPGWLKEVRDVRSWKTPLLFICPGRVVNSYLSGYLSYVASARCHEFSSSVLTPGVFGVQCSGGLGFGVSGRAMPPIASQAAQVRVERPSQQRARAQAPVFLSCSAPFWGYPEP